MLYPLTFLPILKERVWGGRNLDRLYAKSLPPQVPIGESWEISDRPEDVSVIAAGPLAGHDLRWLMEHHAADLLGRHADPAERFPLLVKILDAQDILSLQVHPPVSKAAELGGEPKTEMWFVADAQPGAELLVGLKRGVTREQFVEKIRDGSVADCFHRVPVRPGDAMFLPSGRVHALGAGLVIFEIQQNSDTTYRVFDWNRVGLDGKPRQLHIQQSLASIDFGDYEPLLVQPTWAEQDGGASRPLVRDPLFRVDQWRLSAGQAYTPAPSVMRILGVLSGRLAVLGDWGSVDLRAGQFCLLPSCLVGLKLCPASSCEFLLVEPGGS